MAIKAGNYLVEQLYPADAEPRIWEVRAVNRGKVDLEAVDGTTLTRLGRTQRVDLAWAQKMRAYDANDLALVRLVRELRTARVKISEYIRGLPAAGR